MATAVAVSPLPARRTLVAVPRASTVKPSASTSSLPRWTSRVRPRSQAAGQPGSVMTLPGWPAACERGRTLLVHRGRELVEALGFTVEARGTATSVLRAGEGDTATAVAIFLAETETYEGAAQRFSGASPVSFAPVSYTHLRAHETDSY